MTLGDIYLVLQFNYSITGASQKIGFASGEGLLDEDHYFIKKIIKENDYLEWEPTNISNLHLTFPFDIVSSSPALEGD